MLERRALLGVGALIVATSVSEPGSGCTLLASVRPRRFDDAACRREIAGLVALLNTPSLSEQIADAWLADRSVVFGDELFVGANSSSTDLLRTFLVSDGKPDAKPMRLEEVELIRQRRNRAAYALTLRRYRYTAADDEGCNGMFTHGEFWADARTAYLAAFENNRMTGFREFPEWFVEGR